MMDTFTGYSGPERFKHLVECVCTAWNVRITARLNNHNNDFRIVMVPASGWPRVLDVGYRDMVMMAADPAGHISVMRTLATVSP